MVLGLLLGKIEFSELAVVLLCGLVISACCVLGGRKLAEAKRFFINGYPGRPSIVRPRMQADAFEATPVCTSPSAILTVLNCRTLPKIFSSIIKAIVVFVVRILIATTTQNDSMHEKRTTFVALSSDRIESVAKFRPVGVPIPLVEPLVVGCVHDCVLALRQRNKAVGLVKRLNDLVAFHGQFHWSSEKGLLKFSRYLLIIPLLFLAPFAFSQSTVVSGTIVDSSSQSWNNGTYQFVFQPSPSNPTAQYYLGGVPFSSSQTIAGNLDGTGTFSVSVPSNTSITPSGSTWAAQFCPAATATSGCFKISLTITGPTQNISSAAIPPPIVVNLATPFAGATAYTDSEISGAKTGSQYFNLSDSTLHVCAGFPPCTWISIGATASILPANNTFTGLNTFSQQVATFGAGITGTGTIGTLGLGATALGANNGWTGNETHNGLETFGGSSVLTNPCAIDGVLYVSTAGCYSTYALALAACPSTCIIDGRGAGLVTTLGTIDPGTTALTILAGPYSYSITQITVRNNFQFIGTNGTVLTQSSASTAPFVLPTTGALVADNVRLKDFSLQAAAGSSTDGISMVAALNGGLFYSSFENITIGSVTPFGRNQLRFDSSASGAPLSTTDQFIWVERVFAFRGTNGPPALRITGPYSGQMTFQTCQFDGVGASGPDTSAHNNIQIDDGNTTSGEWLPYSIKFINLTSQNASHSGGAAIFLNGVESVDVDEGHFENDNGVIIETQSSYHGNSAHIHDSYFATTAVNGGSGFIATMDAGSKLTFNDNTFNATPDQFYIGSSTAFVSAKDNWNASNNSWLAVNVSKFLTQFQVYTCAAGANQLPSASTAGAGATAIVSDANSYTPGTCTGGGSDYMIAVSNGSVWTVH